MARSGKNERFVLQIVIKVALDTKKGGGYFEPGNFADLNLFKKFEMELNLGKLFFYLILVLGMLTLQPCYCSADSSNLTDNQAAHHNSIQLIRNATMKINYVGVTFLTDPMFSAKGEITDTSSP